MNLEIQARFVRQHFTLDVDIRVTESVTGIFGPSGSGKTTLLHLLAGLIKPDAGRIVLDGHVLCDTARNTFCPPNQRYLGMVFQDLCLFPHLNVKANLTYGERLVPPGARRFKFEDVIGMLELEPLLARWPAQLSGGERQRVALGRAILSSPRLLLLDEPMTSLDRRLKKQIIPFLRRVRDTTQIPMLYVSHDSRDILDLTEQFLVMEAGSVLGHGTRLDLAENPRILPLLQEDGLTNTIPLVVTQHLAEEGMTRFCLQDRSTDSPSISGLLMDAPMGTVVDMELRPEDVVLSLSQIEGVSLQNQIQGRVVRLTATATREICVVDIGTPIIAEITHAARQRLRIETGSTVWCLFKACALRERTRTLPG